MGCGPHSVRRPPLVWFEDWPKSQPIPQEPAPHPWSSRRASVIQGRGSDRAPAVSVPRRAGAFPDAAPGARTNAAARGIVPRTWLVVQRTERPQASRRVGGDALRKPGAPPRSLLQRTISSVSPLVTGWRPRLPRSFHSGSQVRLKSPGADFCSTWMQESDGRASALSKLGAKRLGSRLENSVAGG